MQVAFLDSTSVRRDVLCPCACRGFVTQWDQYFEQYKGIYTRLPVMTLPGMSGCVTMACSIFRKNKNFELLQCLQPLSCMIIPCSKLCQQA